MRFKVSVIYVCAFVCANVSSLCRAIYYAIVHMCLLKASRSVKPSAVSSGERECVKSTEVVSCIVTLRYLSDSCLSFSASNVRKLLVCH